MVTSEIETEQKMSAEWPFLQGKQAHALLSGGDGSNGLIPHNERGKSYRHFLKPPCRRTVTSLLLSAVFSTQVSAQDPAPAATNLNAEIYNRASTQFDNARLFKPQDIQSDDLSVKLAPLMLEEIPKEIPKGRPGSNLVFGAIVLTNGACRLDCSRPTIYFQIDSVLLRGTPHMRVSYIWFAPGGPPTLAKVVGQGVRITLDSRGEPMLWEVLTDPSGLELLFVSRRLEAAAAAEFGAPLTGRRFSIERALTETSRTEVARIIEDGPVPMGPILYLRPTDYSISTLICRCMPAQAKALAGTTVYTLSPWSAVEAFSAALKSKICGKHPCAFWPGEPEPRDRLTHLLRWPSDQNP
jgi:hypothetical protein